MSKNKKDLHKQIKSNYGSVAPLEEDLTYPHGGRDAIYDFTFALDNSEYVTEYKLIEHDMMIGELLSINYQEVLQVHLTLDWFDNKVTLQIIDKGVGVQSKGSMSDLFVKSESIDFFTQNEHVVTITPKGIKIDKLREDI